MAKESTWTLDSDHPRLGGVSDHSSDDELIDYEVNNDCLSEESISEAEGEDNQVHELKREGKLFWYGVHVGNVIIQLKLNHFVAMRAVL